MLYCSITNILTALRQLINIIWSDVDISNKHTYTHKHLIFFPPSFRGFIAELWWFMASPYTTITNVLSFAKLVKVISFKNKTLTAYIYIFFHCKHDLKIKRRGFIPTQPWTLNVRIKKKKNGKTERNYPSSSSSVCVQYIRTVKAILCEC